MKNLKQIDLSPRVQMYEDDDCILVRVWIHASRNGRWTDYRITGQSIPAGVVVHLNDDNLKEVRRLTENRILRHQNQR